MPRRVALLVGLVVSLLLGVLPSAGAAEEVDIVFAVDESGSMCTSPAPSKVALEVEGLKAALDNVIVPFIAEGGGPIRVAVVRFSSSASTAAELTDVSTPEGVAAVKAALDQIKDGPACENTDVTAALNESDSVLGGGAHRKVINLVTDGNPTVGENPVTSGVCDNLKTAGREIWTIAIGPGANEELLESCSGPGIDKAFSSERIDEFLDIEREKLGAILQLGSVTVISEVVGEAPDSNWQYTGDLGTFTLPPNGGQRSFPGLTPGDYSISEVSQPSYVVSVSCDSGEGNSTSVSVSLEAGESIICTFTNTMHENQFPTADPQSLTADEDTPLDITLTGSDPDDDYLAFAITRQPTNGTLGAVTPVDAASAAITYTPSPNYTGSDSFTFQVDDGRGGSDTADVTIIINPLNDPPLAEDKSVEVSCLDFPLSLDLPVSDADGDPLTCSIVDAPDKGIVDIDDCTVTYTPAAGFTGSDSFTYTANDGAVDGNTASISISMSTLLEPLFFDDLESGAKGWEAWPSSQWHLADDTPCFSPGYVSPTRAWYFGDEESCSYSGRARGNLWSPAIYIPECIKQVAVSFEYLLDLDRKDRMSFYHKRYEITVCFYRKNGYHLGCQTIWNLSLASYERWSSSGNLLVSVPADAALLKLRFSAMGRLWHNQPKGAGWVVDNVKVDATAMGYPETTGAAPVQVNDPLGIQLDGVVSSPNPVSGRTRFVARGHGIEQVKVSIFDASGRTIFESRWVTNDLLWEAQDNQGNLLANGVYLYVITVKGPGDKVIRSRVSKFAVLR